MTRRSILFTLPSVMLFALAASAGPAATRGATPSPRAAVRTTTGASVDAAAQAKGRYKKGGNSCRWDADDSGPNQCEPMIKGRFTKGANDACTWDATSLGADECRPAKGRWKSGGDNSCAWNADDSGPDQCDPRKAR